MVTASRDLRNLVDPRGSVRPFSGLMASHAMALLAVSFAIGACTAQLYRGPSRPKTEVAAIESDGVRIVAVDEQSTESGRRYEILPGAHSVTLLLGYDTAAGIGRYSKNAIAVCFTARAGHVYLARPVYHDATWHPEIIDENVTRAIATTATSTVVPDCSPAPPPRRPMTPAPPAPLATASTASPEPDGRTVRPQLRAEPDGGAPPGETTVAVAGPPNAPSPSRDTEIPRIKLRPSPPPNFSEAPRPPHHPGTAIALELGYDFGGDTLTYNSGINAGAGMALSLLGSVTPLWIGDKAGFGIGLSAGWKRTGASNGGLSFSRFPIAVFAQALLRLHERWFMLFRAGTVRAVSPSLGETDLESRQGAFIDWGIYRGLEDLMGLVVLIRYTKLELSYLGSTIGADSVGAAVSVFFGD